MFRVGKNNPEYMGVLTEIVYCLFRELRHPRLSPPSAKDLTEWFHHIGEDEVEEALRRVLTQERPTGAQHPENT
jgi:hypothetical protein